MTKITESSKEKLFKIVRRAKTGTSPRPARISKPANRSSVPLNKLHQELSNDLPEPRLRIESQDMKDISYNPAFTVCRSPQDEKVPDSNSINRPYLQRPDIMPQSNPTPTELPPYKTFCFEIFHAHEVALQGTKSSHIHYPQNAPQHHPVLKQPGQQPYPLPQPQPHRYAEANNQAQQAEHAPWQIHQPNCPNAAIYRCPDISPPRTLPTIHLPDCPNAAIDAPKLHTPSTTTSMFPQCIRVD
jgi:hypothetical protein